jgi:2-polyprenyl-3-methyl-5-hydroxy-6-metoxy-1,4-benzoquinol methylase
MSYIFCIGRHTSTQQKSLLDWGCNDGYGMELMRPYVAHIAGLDSAETAILAAHQKLPDLQSNIRVYDGKGLPFPPGRFDVVTSFQVIEHVGKQTAL